VAFHTFNQIIETGKMKLFRSHRADVSDGEQARDFIYVKDVTNVCYFMMQHQVNNGIFNLGTGMARTFCDLATTTFASLGKNPDIDFIDTPEDIRDTYQYHTCAEMQKLRSAGYTREFYTLEQGVQEYVQNYLKDKSYY